VTWWGNFNIKPLQVAKGLWEQTHPKSASPDTQQLNEIAAKTATDT
jgi:hypothetical protein